MVLEKGSSCPISIGTLPLALSAIDFIIYRIQYLFRGGRFLEWICCRSTVGPLSIFVWKFAQQQQWAVAGWGKPELSLNHRSNLSVYLFWVAEKHREMAKAMLRRKGVLSGTVRHQPKPAAKRSPPFSSYCWMVICFSEFANHAGHTGAEHLETWPQVSVLGAG